jgi:hypothetical protein
MIFGSGLYGHLVRTPEFSFRPLSYKLQTSVAAGSRSNRTVRLLHFLRASHEADVSVFCVMSTTSLPQPLSQIHSLSEARWSSIVVQALALLLFLIIYNNSCCNIINTIPRQHYDLSSSGREAGHAEGLVRPLYISMCSQKYRR